jgi:hypothetical protein
MVLLLVWKLEHLMLCPALSPLRWTDSPRSSLFRLFCTNKAYALGEIGSEKAIFGLCTVLQDLSFDPETRSAAAYALGEIGSEEAIPELFAALKDLGRVLKFWEPWICRV